MHLTQSPLPRIWHSDPVPVWACLARLLVSNLLRARAGINRPELCGRRVPGALNPPQVDVCVALARAMGLSPDEQVLVAQTVGQPAAGAQA